MQVNPTIAAGDFKVSTDGGALGNLTTIPAVTPAGSAMIKFTLSAAEMNGDNITVVGIDAAGSEWCDLVVNIQTAANQIDDIKAETALILADTDELQTDDYPTTLATLATTAELNKVPKSDGTTSWNSTALGAINAEVDTAIVTYGLDHLVSASVADTDVADNSIVAKFADSTAVTADFTNYDWTTDSLRAVRDHIGDGTNLSEAGGTGDHLTAINLPNQTMDITGNLSGSVGSVTGAVGSVTGAVGSVTGAVGSVTGAVGSVAGNVDGSVGSISGITFPTNFGDMSITVTTGLVDITQTAADKAWSTAARVLTANTNLNDPTAAVIADAVWDEAVAGHVAVGSFGKTDADILADTNEIQGLAAGATGFAAIDTVVDSVKTVTDQFVFTTANQVDAQVITVATGAIGTGDIAAACLNEIADAVLDRNMATGTDSGSTTVRTVRQALRASRNKVAIVAGTATVYKEDDTVASWTAAISTTAGNPISEVDPAG